jgi:phage-related tail fiber protein
VKILSNLDLNSNQLLNALLQLLGSDPGSPAEGQIWYDSTNHVLKFRNNSATIIAGRLDQISAPTASVALNSQKITGLLDPTSAQDAATKAYVDATKTGFDLKDSVRVASTANVTVSGPGAAIDGVTLSNGDRVLLKNQTTGSENGIYVFNGSAVAMTRATDADAAAEVTAGMSTVVEEGTANADTFWYLTTNNPITVGTTSLTFAKLGPSTVTLAKFSATGPSGAGTTWAVSHNLGTADITYVLRDASTNAHVIADAVHTDANTLTFTFGASQGINSLRVVVIG